MAGAAVLAAPVVNAITPEAMLGAPRRGVAAPNPSGVRTFFVGDCHE